MCIQAWTRSAFLYAPDRARSGLDSSPKPIFKANSSQTRRIAMSSISTDLCTGMHKSLVGTSSRWPCCARSLHTSHLNSHNHNQLSAKVSGKAINPCWRLPSGRAAFTVKCSSQRTPSAVQAVRHLHKPSSRGQVCGYCFLLSGLTHKADKTFAMCSC